MTSDLVLESLVPHIKFIMFLWTTNWHDIDIIQHLSVAHGFLIRNCKQCHFSVSRVQGSFSIFSHYTLSIHSYLNLCIVFKIFGPSNTFNRRIVLLLMNWIWNYFSFHTPIIMCDQNLIIILYCLFKFQH